MGQLRKWQHTQLYPNKSSRIFFIVHVLNGGKALSRCLKSILPLTKNIVVLIDDRTRDGSFKTAKRYAKHVEKFKWRHSFSYAKNLCVQTAMDKAGLKYGDWILVMGVDFQLQRHTVKEIKQFVKDEGNFFAQFNVPEYHPQKNKRVVSRTRKLLYRHHMFIHWEKSVHEEAVYSAYQISGLGIPFGGVEEKEFPLLGGERGMLHYGFFEDGGEYGRVFWRKKGYYRTLTLIDHVRLKRNYPETFFGTWRALCAILNKLVDPYEMDKEIIRLAKRYQKGDLPPGLAKYRAKGIFDYDI